MPNVYIIAGPNGAGKTTFAERFIPHYTDCTEFVNADMIARGLSPFAPDRVSLQAGRIMLERLRWLAEKGLDFAFETTLSGKTYARFLRRLRTQGYQTHLFYLWPSDADTTLARIANRVSQGGHDIPEPTVRRRFNRSIWNLFHIYMPVVDNWRIFDNSGDTPSTIAFKEEGEYRVINVRLFEKLSKIEDEQ